MKECITHHNACDCREELMLKVINDLVGTPKGVVPDSVYELYSEISFPGTIGFKSDIAETTTERGLKEDVAALNEALAREHNEFYEYRKKVERTKWTHKKT